MIRRDVEAGDTAGISVLVRENGEERFFDVQGYADLENGKELRRDSIFRIYSMTKPITAAAAMLLTERGMLDLNMPVSQVLPGFASLTVSENGAVRPPQRDMTVLHLLSMTSGLTYGDDQTPEGRLLLEYIDSCMGRMNTPDEVTTCDFADGLGGIPLAFDPDSSWHYGLSADVLGAVIEKVSDMRFGEFLEENLFGPLNMKDTGFYVPEEKSSRLARVYRPEKDGSMSLFTENHMMVSNAMNRAPRFESGGGGLVSTIDDYAAFAQMLLNGGSLNGVRILSPKTVGYMTSGALTRAQQVAMREFGGHEGYTYTHLLRRLTEPGQACLISDEGEYGWAGMLGCYFANIPCRSTTVLMMQQRFSGGTTPLIRRIRNVLSTE